MTRRGTATVACPQCGAKPTAPCVGHLDGGPLVPVPFHYARVRAAVKASR
jgi:hypothetical protein